MSPETESDVEPCERGLALKVDGRDIRLKWHMLRRRANDPPYLRSNLWLGLSLGATLEVDIRLLSCGRFVCLHNEHLDAETTGTGPVCEIDSARIDRLRMRSPDPDQDPGAPMLLDELVACLGTSAYPGPSARAQLDLQEPFEAITDDVAMRFAATVQPVARHLILSGLDWLAVKRLGGAVPGLELGYDPERLARFWDFDRRHAVAKFCGAVATVAPEASMIYLNRSTLRAQHARRVDIVGSLQVRNFLVDCWTIDDGAPDALEDLKIAAAAGVDQITTNTPVALAARAATILDAPAG